jgi:hypothetical protein
MIEIYNVDASTISRYWVIALSIAARRPPMKPEGGKSDGKPSDGKT